MGLVFLYLVLISALRQGFGSVGAIRTIGEIWVGGVIGWLLYEYLRPYLRLRWLYRVLVIGLASLFVFTSSPSLLGRGLVLVLLGKELVNRANRTDRTNRTNDWARVFLAGWWCLLNYLLIFQQWG